MSIRVRPCWRAHLNSQRTKLPLRSLFHGEYSPITKGNFLYWE
jgi:hypothetical protein